MSGDIAILMRSHNDAAFVRATLQAFFSQQCNLPFTVYSCDDGSDDGTGDLIGGFPAVHRIPRPDGPYFPGRTLNWMVRHCSQEYVVFNNADATPADSAWLRELTAPLVRREAEAAFANQLPRPDALRTVRRDHARAFGDGRISARWPFFFSLASSATRRDLLLAHPFDECYRYSEDVEWARRCAPRRRYCPNARVMHSHNYPLDALYRRFYGEGYAEGQMGGAPPSWWRTAAAALCEAGRDAAYLLRCPAAWHELAAVIPRRWVQKSAFRSGVLAAIRERRS